MILCVIASVYGWVLESSEMNVLLNSKVVVIPETEAGIGLVYSSDTVVVTFRVLRMGLLGGGCSLRVCTVYSGYVAVP